MKAAIFTEYGPAEVVRIQDVEQPVPKDHEVLLKVRAASVNPLDWHAMRGKPYLMRVMGGLRAPKDGRLGVDVAGEIASVGSGVSHLKTGDEVFGVCKGAFAEFACASESALVTKPGSVTFEQAASIPVAAYAALQGLRDKGQIQAGRKVLINGAAGGVGTFAVQIARSFSAEVTGVCSARNVNMVRSLGANRVIDYTREDFTGNGQHYDLILDCVGNHSLPACTRVLSRKGFLVVVSGPDGPLLGPAARLFKALALSPFVSQRLVPFIAKPNIKDLIALLDLIASGKVAPVIDRTYRLSEVPDAMRYLEEGHARGKVVIKLE